MNRARTSIPAGGPQPACQTPTPAACPEPFGQITFTARVDGNHLVFEAAWSTPLPDEATTHRDAVLSAFVVCCNDVLTSHFNETIVPGTATAAVVSILAATIDAECAAADTIAVRCYLHWRQRTDEAFDPPAVGGSAVFDVVFDRSGSGYVIAGSTQWSGLADVCFPALN